MVFVRFWGKEQIWGLAMCLTESLKMHRYEYCTLQ